MELPPSKSNHFFEHDQKIQDLLKKIKDATCKLQAMKSEREKVQMEIHQCLAELSPRPLQLLPVEVHEVYSALMELEHARQKNQALIQRLQHLNTISREMRLTGHVMQNQVEAVEGEVEGAVCMKETLDDGLSVGFEET